MSAAPHTAMVLAAGKGTRMHPLTETRPKPLIEVAGRPLMDRLLDALAAAGVQRIVVNLHWLADQVEAHLKARSDFELVLSDERGELLETGGALAKAAPLLGEEPVFVVNTDAFWAPAGPGPLTALAAAYDPAVMDELLLLADRERALGFAGPGDFLRAEDGRLARRGATPAAPWAYAGVRVTRAPLYAGEAVEPFSANRLWDPMIAAGRLYGLPLDRFWLHVGDPGALKDANMWMACHGA